MQYVRTADIALALIEVPERLRPIDTAWADAIAESMARHGQKTPIEVVEQSGTAKYRLVAGGHRFHGAERNGWATIRAEIKRSDAKTATERDLELQLAEIDENLHRHELNPLDRAVFIGRRQEIYEALHPETKNGAQGGRDGKRNENETISFSKETAEKIGLGRRSVERACRIFRLLSPAVRERIAGTHLAKSEGELYQLTRYSAEQQAEIAERCLTPTWRMDKQVYPSVAQIGAVLDGTAIPTRAAHETETAKLRDAWDRAGARAKTAHLQFLVEIGVIESFTTEHL